MAIARPPPCCGQRGGGGERQAGGADPATGGAQGAGPATQDGAAAAGRRCLASASGPSIPTTPSPHDFVEARTHEGRKVRMLDRVDEVTRERPALRVARKLTEPPP